MTILLQHSRYPATSTERGFNPILNYVAEVEKSGHYTLFRQRAEENVRNWARKSMRLRPHHSSVSDDENKIDAILSILTQTRSTTYIILYPYHAQIRMLIERLGMGKLFEDWKKLIVTVAERHGSVEVWDFSGLSSETLEAIPAKGDHQTHLKNYWEAGHFKKELGDLVIAQVLGNKGGFGIRLDSGNVDLWLVKDRSRVKALLDRPSPLTIEVDDLIARYAGK